MTAPIPDFLGRPEAYLEWAAAHPQHNPHWCHRHWMPCPVEGLNGLLATLLIMQTVVDELMPDDVVRGSAGAKNSWVENQIVPTCCRLGDDRMAALWMQVRRP